MPSQEIIKTSFWPVIHYNITARSLKTQKPDLLGLGLGEGWAWWRETQGSVRSLPRRNPHRKKKKKCAGCFLVVTGCSWSTCCVSGLMGHKGDQADIGA